MSVEPEKENCLLMYIVYVAVNRGIIFGLMCAILFKYVATSDCVDFSFHDAVGSVGA
jgi:hypothetical protein